MHECGAAILIFSADEEFPNKDGEVVYRPSENVVFELGAASALYGSRIIIFRDSRVQFPTNFREIGYITFEPNQLSAKVNELFRELIGFGLIKIVSPRLSSSALSGLDFAPLKEHPGPTAWAVFLRRFAARKGQAHLCAATNEAPRAKPRDSLGAFVRTTFAKRLVVLDDACQLQSYQPRRLCQRHLPHAAKSRFLVGPSAQFGMTSVWG